MKKKTETGFKGDGESGPFHGLCTTRVTRSAPAGTVPLGIICLSCVMTVMALGGPAACAVADDIVDKPPAQSAAELRFRSIVHCMELGRTLFERGDYLHAAIQFEKVLALDAGNSVAKQYMKRCEEHLRGK